MEQENLACDTLVFFMQSACTTFQGKTLVEQEKLACKTQVVNFAHACVPQDNVKKIQLLE